ncbi:hypothetical protein TNCV_4114561 [Trichonephila clavipes]|nr:hypothetical protein TNCV_4114561 [Trichonephila clavipes]
MKSKGIIEAFTMGPPHTNTIVITAQIESGFFAGYDLFPFRRSPIPLGVTPHSTEASVGGCVNAGTSIGRRDTRCLSALQLETVREETGDCSEEAACD